MDILGIADAPAAVKVNNVSAYEKGEYYWRSLPVTNSSAVVWASVTNSATEGTTTNALGKIFFPSAAERPQYDADGNLTQDTRWQYTWDAENRLTRMETLASAVSNGVPRLRLDFGYDWEGRRLSKTVLTGWVSTNYATTNITRFVWNNWNLMAELSEANTPLRSYAWGLDLSGMLEDEGNVGGMVEMLDHSTGPPGRHFAAYDGNGNLVATVNASSVVSSRMEFGPFGEVIRKTASVTLPLQWCTRYTDAETDLTYYGFRFYDCRLGRWIGRDPIEEQDTVNLFAYVKNGPLSLFDRLGKTTSGETGTAGAAATGMESGGGASQAISYLNQVRQWADKWNDMQDLISIATDMFSVIDQGDEIFDKLMNEGRQNLSKGPTGRMGRAHHSIPRFLGGHEDQALIDLGGKKHESFHRLLAQEMKALGLPTGMGGSKKDYATFTKRMMSDRSTRRNVMRALLRASFKLDDAHGGKGALPTSVLMHLLDRRWLKKQLSQL